MGWGLLRGRHVFLTPPPAVTLHGSTLPIHNPVSSFTPSIYTLEEDRKANLDWLGL